MVEQRRVVVVMGALLLVWACTGTTANTEPAFTLPPPDPTTTTPAPDTTSPAPPDTTTPPPPTTQATDLYLWQAGDCVNLGTDTTAQLPHAPYGSSLVVACEDLHTHEVYFTSMLEEPPGDPYPVALREGLWETCYRQFSSQMGFLASSSTLELILYLPDEAEWAAGERYHACVVYQFASDAEYALAAGSVTSDPESYFWIVPEGACLNTDASSIRTAPPVACGEEHSFEHIGEAVHTAPEGAPYPGELELLSLFDQTCNSQLVEFASFDVDPLLVRAFTVPLLLPETDWNLGQRSLPCLGFAATVDGILFNMRGSFSDEAWQVLEPRGTEDGVTAVGPALG